MQKAFTLIELLIVLVVLAILSLIAYPAYSEHLVKVRRSYALVALRDLAARMEEYYVAYNTYSGATLTAIGFSDSTYKSFYNFTITAKDDSYLLQAIPVSQQLTADVQCGTLSLDQDSKKAISGSGSLDECW